MDRSTLKHHARNLRTEQTPHEQRLWQRLRMRQVGGVRFLRQYVAEGFILDFYAPSIQLAIELDGGQHYTPGALGYDAARTRLLASDGIEVLRYTNLDVTERLDAVLDDIARAVARLRAHPPAPAARPPSCGRG